jgi:DNA-binding transcriptional LysR family regulator
MPGTLDGSRAASEANGADPWRARPRGTTLLRRAVCASPACLKVRGTPTKPADLASHDSVAYEGYGLGSNWDFRTEGTLPTIVIPSRLVVNSAEAAVIAATDGAGIARALSYQVDALVKARSLATLMEAYEPSPIPVAL